jgi:hypothetical protein
VLQIFRSVVGDPVADCCPALPARRPHHHHLVRHDRPNSIVAPNRSANTIRFSNRPFGVKRFQTIHHHSVDTLRRVLALIFPAGGLVLFIPWRLAAERGAEFSLALGGGAGAVGRAQVWGRAQRAAVATALVGCLSMSSSLSRFSGWRSRSLSLGEGLTDSSRSRPAPGVVDLRRGQRQPYSLPSRAPTRRELIRRALEADRPARAAGSALRLLVDVAIFVLAKLLVGRFWSGADDGAQAVAADVGFAGSGRWRWCGRRSSATRYGVMTTDRKICSTYRGCVGVYHLRCRLARARRAMGNGRKNTLGRIKR